MQHIQSCSYYVPGFFLLSHGYGVCNAIGLCCRIFCAKQGKVRLEPATSLCRLFLLFKDVLLESKLPIASSYLEKFTELPSSPFTSWSRMGRGVLQLIHQMDECANPPLEFFLSFSPVFVQDHASYPRANLPYK